MSDEMSTRVARLEGLMYGPDDEPERGMLHRFLVTEKTAEEVRNYLEKIMWLIVMGVVVGVLNLVVQSGAIRFSPPSSTPSTAPSK